MREPGSLKGIVKPAAKPCWGTLANNDRHTAQSYVTRQKGSWGACTPTPEDSGRGLLGIGVTNRDFRGSLQMGT